MAGAGVRYPSPHQCIVIREITFNRRKDLSKLKAVLLVGGPGTRLQPLTDYKPKSIVPLLNRPVLEHTLAYLKHYGIEDVILTLNYLPDMIQEYFGDGKRCGVKLTYCIEQEPLGTAGAVKNAAAYLDSSFFVLNGDLFTDMDLADMLDFHHARKAAATISLTWVDNPSAFGVVETGTDSRVKAFIEKPPPGTETTNWINAGTYVLEPEVLEHIPAGQHYMFERGLFPSLLDMGKPVFGYEFKGYWLDMGTPEKYFSLNMDLLKRKIVSPLLREKWNDGIYIGEDANIHPSAVIRSPVIIGDYCRIGRDARITGPAVIGRGCRLVDGVSLENAVIWDRVTIGANARLNHCIISDDVIIADDQNIVDSIVTPGRTVSLPVTEDNRS
jgi:mannose-1-phosphate guanylyltransferase